MYRIGFPFWKQAARMGVHMKIRVNVIHDSETDMFVATSNDLRGLVCEASTVEELTSEMQLAIESLLEYHLEQKPPSKPVADMRLCVA